MTPALEAALTAIAAARQVLRARTPGTPAGDKDEEHEANTFGLPEGRPIRRAFKRFAKRQLRKTLSRLPDIGAPLPAKIPSVADWTDPMASAMTPIIGTYWDDAGSTTRARLGLDPNQWEVHDPHLHEQIQKQAFRFCQSTNETTDTELGAALEQLRQELIEGLVEAGDSITELTRRVQKVFGRLSDTRAEMIARTEAARAVHSASIISAKDSGVVAGKKWLLSADACPYCHQVAAKFPGGTGLDADFNNDGKGTDYSSCPAPPLHPNCRCSITFVLTEEYEQLLAATGPPEPELYDYMGGSLGPEPKKRKIAKAAARKPKPPPEILPEIHPPNPKPWGGEAIPPKTDKAGNTEQKLQPPPSLVPEKKAQTSQEPTKDHAFTDLKEVIDWAQKAFPNAKVNVSGIHPEHWNVIATEIDYLLKKFPEVGERMQNFGDMKAGRKIIAHAIAGSGRELKFNKDWWNRPTELEQAFKVGTQAEFHPKNVEHAGLRYYVTHEFGHLVDGLLEKKDNKTWKALAANFRDDKGRFDPLEARRVSQYAATEQAEAFAESFAAARWRKDKANPIVNDFKERLGL